MVRVVQARNASVPSPRAQREPNAQDLSRRGGADDSTLRDETLLEALVILKDEQEFQAKLIGLLVHRHRIRANKQLPEIFKGIAAMERMRSRRSA